MTAEELASADRTPWHRRRSPAQHLAASMERGSCAQVGLREAPFLTQIALRAAPGGAAVRRLEHALGGRLPQRVLEVCTTPDGLDLLWLAPDEFLAVGPDGAGSGPPTDELLARLTSALGTARGQVVDVSANRATFELSGPAARTVLEKSVRIDLHPRAFPVGAAAVTPLDTTPAIVWRTAEETWRVLVRSSFAGHTTAWLLDGMREYV